MLVYNFDKFLMSRTKRIYMYYAIGLLAIFKLLIIIRQSELCLMAFIVRTLCDAYHKEKPSHCRCILGIPVK